MLRSILTAFTLPMLLLLGSSSNNSAAPPKQKSTDIQTETVEKLIVVSGSVTVDIDLNRLNDAATPAEESKPESLRFALSPDSFFTIIVTNDVLRGPLSGSMGLIPQNAANLPELLAASLHRLVLEKMQSDEAPELVIRDDKTKLAFFNIVGCEYDYDANARSLNIKNGRLLVSEDFAKQLRLPSEAQQVIGRISVTASMQPIEIKTVVDGEVQSAVLPALHRGTGGGTEVGTTPGPDVIVGVIFDLIQSGSAVSGKVGISAGTDSCNSGNVDLDWFALPSNDHPVIPQNLYRMSGGTGNSDRFEQIGQSWLKHAFTAASSDSCGFGCNGVGGTHLGSGCSDLYSAGLNASQGGLGSRAWVNPFTGVYPRGDSSSPPSNHTGHTHTDTSHRMPVNVSDLDTTQNAGAIYFAEGQYVTPHEYNWCQSNPTQCNQYNNVSYRRFTVTGTTSFTFSTAAATVQMQPAIKAWTGATINQIEPAKDVDGIGFVGSKVTGPSAGVWHYEYAVYNENIDRAIQSFSVPLGAGIIVSNIGFHAPLQEPGWANDGTLGNTGYSSVAWTPTQTSSSLTWNSETFAQNQNANAIRWGTLYNFRFDANSPPQTANATIGFFKTGSPITVAIQRPSTFGTPTPSPTPTATATATATVPPTPTPTPTPSPTLVATVSLPTAAIDTSLTDFIQPVVTSTINGSDNLIGFQGDFTFNSSVVTFQSTPVSSAGLTANNWNVSGNILPGGGTIKTLRISAFSNNFAPLSGSGTLFHLNMTRLGNSGANTALTWAAPPNDFYYIDSNLGFHAPGSTPAGSITFQAGTTIAISGTISYCPNPSLNPVPGVTLTLTGNAAGSTSSNGSGNYTLSPIPSGGSFTVTPAKAALAPGSAGINTVDVVATQRHFLNLGAPLSGCPLAAADVNGDSLISTTDVVAIQRFALGFSNGIANTGTYGFSPTNRTYPGIVSNQSAQNYDALVFGDVASSFVQ